jgi:CBS domain containing-hemolysin-like protein
MGIRYSFILVKSSLEIITEQMSSVEDDDDVDSEIQMFQNALEFSGVKERYYEPRTELAIELFDSIAELKELFIETGYSKVVVYQNSLDDIVGTCIRLICLEA